VTAQRQMTPLARPPARLALQTGGLDDHRPSIAPHDNLWQTAYELFVERQHVDGVEHAARHDERLSALCAAWPMSDGEAEPVEALAVTVALAAPFAGEHRVLMVLAVAGSETAELGRLMADAPVFATPGAAERPHFPHIYDPDVEERAPISAMLDGPRSTKVAEFLTTIQERDHDLADAIVLGADLEMLDLLHRLLLDAKRAGRTNLENMFAQDRQTWRDRAEAIRARQRLEGAAYHWHSDNLPPGCIPAARGEAQHDVEVLLDLPPTNG